MSPFIHQVSVFTSHIQIIISLVLDCIMAVSFAAHLTQKLPMKRMMIFIGIVVILVSIRLLNTSISDL